MDEFLRSASHQLVTGALLLVWSGLLAGITWKVISFALKTIPQMLPRRQLDPSPLRELPVQRARLPGSTSPLLETRSPDRLLAEAPLPLLPDPHNELTCQLFHTHKHPKTIGHKHPAFAGHKHPAFAGHKEKTTL